MAVFANVFCERRIPFPDMSMLGCEHGWVGETCFARALDGGGSGYVCGDELYCLMSPPLLLFLDPES